MIQGRAGKLSVRTKGIAAKPANVVILVQGANMSGQMGYDFSFPGSTDYSMMDAMVEGGFGVVTFSVRGYAASEGPADLFEVQTDAAIEDLASVVDWVRAELGYKRPHLLGWSWGGRITGRYVEDHADKVDRLIMLDPAIGGGNKILPVPTDATWLNSYDYFKDRLVAEFADPAVQELLARRMDKEELRAPNGIRMENAMGSKAVDPSKVTRPTMMSYGIKAGAQNYMHGGWDRLEFFNALATDDKSFAIVPGGGDYAHLEQARTRVFADCIAFLRAA
ncbi:alpha/beta fold hydrolase [Duganella sp. BuS-21]|uniref:alpha/beta fold hydrolase n=1 Tax=Duganella sp. BuS-21 TaxID=2943848 RepID=UPI0035A63D7D